MVDSINTQYLPLWTEHDPRIPPRGRVVDAHIEQLDDAEFAVVGTVEEFERGETVPFDRSRQMKIVEAPETLRIEFDRSYRDKKSQALIADIAAILGTEPQPQVKKAVGPLSILTITAQAILGGITAAITKNLTDDALNRLKQKIALALKRRKDSKREYVFQLEFVVIVGGREVQVDLLATSPSEKQIRRIFDQHLAAVDSVLLRWLPTRPEVRRVVFDVGGEQPKFSYAVRSDVVVLYDGPAAV